MRLDFDYTAEDLRELQKIARQNKTAKQRSTNRGWLGWFLFIAAVVIMVNLLNSNKSPSPIAVPTAKPANPMTDILAPIVPWALVLVVFWFVIFRGRQARFKNHPLLQKPISMEIDDLGIFSSDGPSQTRWLWIAFDRLIETDQRFFLRLTETLNFVIIPKRAMANEAAIGKVRRLLENMTQGTSGGFPVLPLRASEK